MSLTKFISWNVNGIRAAAKKGLLEFIQNSKADFIALQETKAHEDQLSFEIKVLPEYTSYFASGERKGYSGVAVYAQEPALSVSTTLGEHDFDREGRHIIMEYKDFYFINSYFPNGQRSKERVGYKLAYYESMLKTLLELKKTGKAVIVCGDVNTAHQPIDLARPKENEKTSGFLPEERAWLDKLVAAGFSDTFRQFNQAPDNYTWWDVKSRARERNVGWRIDYFFIDSAHADLVTEAGIMADVTGSDHCPIYLSVNFSK